MARTPGFPETHAEGRSALVTGLGRGIGLAIATKLAGWGASAMISDIDEAAAREAAGCLGSPARFVAGDLTLAEFPQTLVDATVGAFGSLDIIVNNAGYTWDSVIQKTTDEQFQAMLDIHIVAPFRVLRAASGWLREAAG